MTYCASSTALLWSDAEEACEAIGMRLTTLNSANDLSMVQSMMSSMNMSFAWVGGVKGATTLTYALSGPDAGFLNSIAASSNSATGSLVINMTNAARPVYSIVSPYNPFGFVCSGVNMMISANRTYGSSYLQQALSVTISGAAGWSVPTNPTKNLTLAQDLLWLLWNTTGTFPGDVTFTQAFSASNSSLTLGVSLLLPPAATAATMAAVLGMLAANPSLTAPTWLTRPYSIASLSVVTGNLTYNAPPLPPAPPPPPFPPAPPPFPPNPPGVTLSAQQAVEQLILQCPPAILALLGNSSSPSYIAFVKALQNAVVMQLPVNTTALVLTLYSNTTSAAGRRLLQTSPVTTQMLITFPAGVRRDVALAQFNAALMANPSAFLNALAAQGFPGITGVSGTDITQQVLQGLIIIPGINDAATRAANIAANQPPPAPYSSLLSPPTPYSGNSTSSSSNKLPLALGLGIGLGVGLLLVIVAVVIVMQRRKAQGVVPGQA